MNHIPAKSVFLLIIQDVIESSFLGLNLSIMDSERGLESIVNLGTGQLVKHFINDYLEEPFDYYFLRAVGCIIDGPLVAYPGPLRLSTINLQKAK